MLHGGTAYLTDVGMTGPLESVIGVRTEIILRRFTTDLPQQFEVTEGPVRLDAALIAAAGGRATGHSRNVVSGSLARHRSMRSTATPARPRAVPRW